MIEVCDYAKLYVSLGIPPREAIRMARDKVVADRAFEIERQRKRAVQKLAELYYAVEKTKLARETVTYLNEHENLINNKNFEEGGKSSSSCQTGRTSGNRGRSLRSVKSSGKTSIIDGHSPSVLNHSNNAATSPIGYEDVISEYFELLRRWVMNTGSSGEVLNVMSTQRPMAPQFSFPYTKNGIRSCCLFVNEENYEIVMRAAGKDSVFDVF